jgi:hypothetical protein
MDEILRKRIERKLDGLPEDKAYQVLDYLEFLESKYGSSARPPTPIERIAEGVGDTMRAARIPAQAIKGTMNAVDSAGRMMRGLVDAGKAAVEELRGAASPPAPAASASPAASPAPAASASPAAPPAPAASPPAEARETPEKNEEPPTGTA